MASQGTSQLPDDLPPFAAELVESGELLAYLHLTGNHAAQINMLKRSSVHKYETSLPSDPEAKVSFSYRVAALLNGDRGDLGQAVAYFPLHAPNRVIIAFRAVRVGAGAGNKVAGNKQDVMAYLDTSFLKTTWLPSHSKMSRGLCRHAGAVWALGAQKGLVAFLLDEARGKEVHFVGLSLAGALAQATALRATVESDTTGIGDRAHVLTFGALPWANAGSADFYREVLGPRSVHLASRLRERTPGLGFAPQWWEEVDAGPYAPADSPRNYLVLDPLTNAFVPEHDMLPNTFAIDAHLAFDDDDDATSADDDGASESGGAGASDALGPSSPWSTGAYLVKLSTFPEAIVPRPRLCALMANRIAPDDALAIDYMRLHRGRAYKAAVKALVDVAVRARRQREAEQREAEQRDAAEQREAAARPSGSAPATRASAAQKEHEACPTAADERAADERAADERAAASSSSKPMRRTASKRTLDEALLADEALLGANDENAADGGNPQVQPATAAALPAYERHPHGRLSKVASYGSLADKLDQIEMF